MNKTYIVPLIITLLQPVLIILVMADIIRVADKGFALAGGIVGSIFALIIWPVWLSESKRNTTGQKTGS